MECVGGECRSTAGSAWDLRDLTIAEQVLVIAEQAGTITGLTARVKELEEKSAKLEVVLAAQAEAKSSKAPVFKDNYDLPDSTDLPLPPGLRDNRSEFGIELILILAFLHYWVGVSIDNEPGRERRC